MYRDIENPSFCSIYKSVSTGYAKQVVPVLRIYSLVT
jgi:hypothetical protein